MISEHGQVSSKGISFEGNMVPTLAFGFDHTSQQDP